MPPSLFRETTSPHYATQIGMHTESPLMKSPLQFRVSFQPLISTLQVIFPPRTTPHLSLKGFPTHSWAAKLGKMTGQTQQHNFDFLC